MRVIWLSLGIGIGNVRDEELRIHEESVVVRSQGASAEPSCDEELGYLRPKPALRQIDQVEIG
jgi:hypothetical protein